MKPYISFIVLLTILASCNKTEPYVHEYDDTPYVLTYSPNLPDPTLSADNPLTAEKINLGRILFYDELLSSDGTVSCASCHLQENGFSDPNQFSFGVNNAVGKRQAMAIFNLAWNTNGFFWDGRAELLRHQSILPIQDPLEMNETLPSVIEKLSANVNYRNHFMRAFGSEEISAERISFALEAFMMSIVSDNSKYDRYLLGTETLTDSEERGRVLYFAEYNPFFPAESGADCAHCHSGNNFENDQYMNNGLDTDAMFTDIGFEAVTGNAEDRAKFKVTSLRNIEVTGPYMHDGRFTTLEEVVEHYNSGIHLSSTVDPAIANTESTGLMLDAQDKIDLVNFLKTLTDDTYLNNSDYSDPGIRY
ncbi:MAG: cytochrome-c peroxidase [Crocinitomicaceae bacterium]|nr:cytochrome-c peroxidase [Crocinitomicaceae bacterium]